MAKLEETKSSLIRMQDFDPKELVRREALGVMHFEEVLEPAGKLVRLYKQLSPGALDDLPPNQLDVVKSQADADHQRFSQILSFDIAKDPNPSQTRTGFISQIKVAYDNTFNQLFPLISYGMSKSVDFSRLETDALAAIQDVKDKGSQMFGALEKTKGDAEKILGDVRKAAAEQGVSQQALYFKSEADTHEGQAYKWQKATIGMAVLLGIASFASLWLHNVPGLDTDAPFRALQVGTSKVLVFLVIGYMLLLSARNYLAHRHNAVVNRHRQNALMTFTALVDAAKGEQATDIVLAHAASCIFSPQETAYSKPGGAPALTRSIIELLPKTSKAGE